MRGALLAVLLLAPVLAGAYHYGPGQTRLKLDDAAAELSQARLLVEQGDHAQAVAAFTKALEQLPSDRLDETRRIRAERAKSMLLASKLPAAYDELTLLLPELEEDPRSAAELLADVRNSLANAKYYLTWLMRLEGKSRDEWEPEIDAARQMYRLLAEQAEARGDRFSLKQHQEDLEAAIRLARLDLSELQALPLPCQCKCCGSGECQCKGKGNKKGKGQGKSMKKPDGDEFARGASSGPPPDDGGN